MMGSYMQVWDNYLDRPRRIMVGRDVFRDRFTLNTLGEEQGMLAHWGAVQGAFFGFFAPFGAFVVGEVWGF